MCHFGRRDRAISYAAWYYPPSDVPEDSAVYSQDRAAHDILAVLDHLGVAGAHVCGLSMGGFATLHFGLLHAARALSLCVAGCGYGAEPATREQFRAEADGVVALLRRERMASFADRYAWGPTRVQFANKDPRGFAVFQRALAALSALGSANTQLGCQKERPSLYDLKAAMGAMTLPTLILIGGRGLAVPCAAPDDEANDPVRGAGGDSELRPHDQPGGSGFVQPDRGDFIAQVDTGRWPMRDSRAVSASFTGVAR